MSPLTKLVVIIVGGVVISIALVSLLVKPNFGRVSVLGKTVEQKKQELATLQQQINAFKTAQSDLARASEKEKVQGTVLLREDLLTAIKNLEVGAAKSGVALEVKINEPDGKTKIAPKAVVADKGELKEIPFRLYTTGDFSGTVKFMQYLEHLPNLSELSKLDLSAETVQIDKTVVQTGKVFGSIDGVFLVKASQ